MEERRNNKHSADSNDKQSKEVGNETNTKLPHLWMEIKPPNGISGQIDLLYREIK